MRPGDDLKIFSDQRRVHRAEHVHEIARDPLAVAAILAQDAGLETQIVGGLVGEPALGIEQRVLVDLRDEFL